ncbi:MAG TPA: CotH kinase family protein, partial [Chthoniobacteraceae bacterium]|nr:CotH kinase family protein [Chthoniobacteraceae bacterium]
MSFPPRCLGGRCFGAVLPLLIALLALSSSRARAEVVINEILYRPGTALPEPTNLEFIELTNTGPDPVSLAGWRFTKGVSFTFPAVTLPSGGFLVVAANVAAFQTANPAVTPVIGGWTGNLSNQGEKLELQNAAGAVVDSVEYSDQGDWALRTRSTTAPTTGGWLWRGAADDTGASLELRNPALPHDRGANWGASAGAGGTPGAANSRAAAEVAPLISEVTHFPPVPTSAQTVTISCQLEDETIASVAAAVLWRVSASAPAAFTSVPMVGASGRYTATIPALADSAIVEFYVSATDGTRTRTWPAPTNEGQNANALYQVSNGSDAGMRAHYRLVMTVPDAATFSARSRNSDAETNTTLIASDAGEPGGFVIRYQSSTRFRGNSSRNYNPPPLRVEVPRDRRWGDLQGMNLNTKLPYMQVLGMKLLAAAGSPAPEARGVKVSINGADRSVTNALMGGLHAHEEPISGDFVDRQFPNDNGGNLYTKRSASSITIDGSTYGRDRQRWGVVGDSIVRYTQPGWYVSEQWSKSTNESAADWSDLTAFAQTMHTATGATYKSQIEAKVNLEQWLRWFATMTLMNNYETNPSNGIDDDYSMYRGTLDPRFVLLPHDLDTILGRSAPGDAVAPANGTLFPFITTSTPPNMGDDRIPQLVAFIQNPEIRARYFAIVKELLTTGIFAKARFDAFVTNQIGGWAPSATISAIISWMDTRRTYALGIVDGSLSVTSPLAVQNGFRRTTVSSAPVSGNVDISDTAAVRVNGALATINAAAGTWSATALGLAPGINRMTVQALDAAGVVLETSTIEVWFDNGTTQSLTGPIAADTTLLAADGPFVITGEVVVNPGATLTIGAGTNLWLGRDAKITVRGILRVLGSEFSHVRFCPDPGAQLEPDPASPGLPAAPPKSGGIRFLDSTSELNVVQWTDLLHAQNTFGSIGVFRSQLLLDHLTFAGTHLRMIYAENASLTVQSSTFPNMFGPNENAESLGLHADSEQMRFDGAPPMNGRLLIRGNTFGTNEGLRPVLRLGLGRGLGPVSQVIDNVFTGSATNGIEVLGDAYIAGNTFAHFARDPQSTGPGYVS